MRLLLSRTTLTVLLAAGLGFGGVTWRVTRPPEWRAWAGETTIAVQVAGAAPRPDRVSLRGGGATVEHRGEVQADRLCFTGLSPDTAYVLEWRAGPFVPAALSVRTLPPVLPLVELAVAPGAGELVVRAVARDPRLAGVDLRITAVAPLAARDGGAVVPIPAGDAATELALLLPATGETLPLDFAVYSADRLVSELARAEADLEQLLAADQAPAFVELSATERWEPAPLPARRSTATGGPGLLARLRRLAPLVRAATAGNAPPRVRWRLAAAASRLAAAEVLARKHQQPNLGVLDWASELVRYGTFDERQRRAGRQLLSHPAHLVHPSFEKNAAASLVNVVGGTADSSAVPSLELPPLLVPPGQPWFGISFIFEAIFNSAPPRLSFPRVDVALELPLVTGAVPPGAGQARNFPVSTVDVWLCRVPPDGDWSLAILDATWHERSGRVSPVYLRSVRPIPDGPPERAR